MLLVLCCAGRAAADAPWVTLTDPAVLASLDGGGFDLGSVAFGARATNAADLAARPGWDAIAALLSHDLRELYAADRQYGVGMRFAHRGFDARWLTAPTVAFELVAVVNRLDRRPFRPDTCGEVRLVYRLAIHRDGAADRLPMTVNVVFFLWPEPGATGSSACAAAARRFTVAQTAADVAGVNGPLAPAVLVPAAMKSVEVNLQTSRWPSTVRPDLGGHADYLLRVFQRGSDGAFTPAPLENTPDTTALGRDRVRMQALRAWIAAHLDEIDAGTARLPEEFLATRAISVTPRGLARLQNRPFLRVLGTTGFAGLALDGRRTIATPAALLRRLDGLSCAGCHQSRSLAGFHLLGEERDPTRTLDALAAGVSPHARDDEPRRRAYLDALLAGTAPDDARPNAERSDASVGRFGERCGLGDPGFARWTCASDQRCTAVDDAEVGVCLPRRPEVGTACVLGRVDPRDTIGATAPAPCPDGRACEAVAVGFPAGMCAGPCERLGPDATCGTIALLQPFNDCLARGEHFSRCARLSRPAALRRCDRDRPCRDDYVCARTPAGDGACLPPYFVPQMRVDGHP